MSEYRSHNYTEQVDRREMPRSNDYPYTRGGVYNYEDSRPQNAIFQCAEDFIQHSKYSQILLNEFTSSPVGQELMRQQLDAARDQRIQFLLYVEERTGTPSRELDNIRAQRKAMDDLKKVPAQPAPIQQNPQFEPKPMKNPEFSQNGSEGDKYGGTEPVANPR